MQNGRIALSSINYNDVPNETILEELLNPVFQNNGENTDLSEALFSSLFPNIDERNIQGLSNEFHKKITKKITKSKLNCIHCGNNGFVDLTSYIYPFVTDYERFPNIYSKGKIRSLKFCNNCLLTSLAAYNKILFKSNRKNNATQYSMILFFSFDDEILKRFYNGFIQVLLKPTSQTNIDIPGLNKKGDLDDSQYSYGRLFYPEDILAMIIDYISNKIKELNDLGKHVGAMLFSFNRARSGDNYINIYDSFDVVDDIYPFVKGLNQFKRITKRNNSFIILFKNLLANNKRESDFIFRRKIFRRLLLFRRFDWKTIENIVMLKASENKYIPYLKPFIVVILEILSLDKEIFNDASNVGYYLGLDIKKKETNPNRLKKFIYELRRARRHSDFLSIVNLMQARASSTIYSKPLFDENNFEIVKVGFLIGYSNAIFE
jgi:hypothetical protein